MSDSKCAEPLVPSPYLVPQIIANKVLMLFFRQSGSTGEIKSGDGSLCEDRWPAVVAHLSQCHTTLLLTVIHTISPSVYIFLLLSGLHQKVVLLKQLSCFCFTPL